MTSCSEVGRNPSSLEIARHLDLTVAEVERICQRAQTPISLESRVGEDDGSERGDFLPDEAATLPDEAAEVTLRNEAPRKLLGTLSDRGRRVFELRYGLSSERPQTLDEVRRVFGVTPERIRQIENQSLTKLGRLAAAEELHEGEGVVRRDVVHSQSS